MEDEKIELMWREFREGNKKADINDFIKIISREFSCSLQEANKKTSHLFLAE
jgi:hypothetical protein